MKSKLIIACLICILAVSLVVAFKVSAQAVQAQDLQTITVRQGDTLWTIAQTHRGNTEIRKYIYKLQKLNDIGSNIYPGQELLLP
ncbi:MAG: LysM peptidoglycan-binding domain-containing protein [Bacillota bacterium]